MPYQPGPPLKKGDVVMGLPGLHHVGDTIWPLSFASSIVSTKPGPHPEWVKRHLKVSTGDRLWVREAWRPVHSTDPSRGAQYRADVGRDQTVWKPGIHMFRWASRLTLIVTGVKVERLQAITPFDAKQEGVIEQMGGWYSAAEGQSAPDPRSAYALLWNSINGTGAWDANPWVAAYTFTVHHQNIDQMEATDTNPAIIEAYQSDKSSTVATKGGEDV